MQVEHSVLGALSGRGLPNEDRQPDQRCYWDGDPFQIFEAHSETLAVWPANAMSGRPGILAS